MEILITRILVTNTPRWVMSLYTALYIFFTVGNAISVGCTMIFKYFQPFVPIAGWAGLMTTYCVNLEWSNTGLGISTYMNWTWDCSTYPLLHSQVGLASTRALASNLFIFIIPRFKHLKIGELIMGERVECNAQKRYWKYTYLKIVQKKVLLWFAKSFKN